MAKEAIALQVLVNLLGFPAGTNVAVKQENGTVTIKGLGDNKTHLTRENTTLDNDLDPIVDGTYVFTTTEELGKYELSTPEVDPFAEAAAGVQTEAQTTTDAKVSSGVPNAPTPAPTSQRGQGSVNCDSRLGDY